ncbi:MAG: hypothetical protein HUJ25_13685, partial [Crocinitomicaceae bacterium]|nr:hypothetical protein [Crocinitomicaceae bacterium]
MKNVAVFGGTGGLGKPISEKLKERFNVITVGSKDVDVTNFKDVKEFFSSNDVDIELNFSGLNYDCFMHKYNEENIHK